jgi:hypothetical protein
MAAEKGLCLTIDYTVEAELQFGDVAYAVKSWKLSQVLECSPSVCHVNVTTKEGITITIRLDSSGFHVRFAYHVLAFGVFEYCQNAS